MPIVYRRNCNNCGEYYEGDGKFFCSVECSREGQGRNGRPKDMDVWNKGLTKETDSRIDYNRPTKFKKGNMINFGRRGDKAPFWKGGITPLVYIIRNSFKYRQWRSDIFTRDDFTCQKCGIRGVMLNAHHIDLFSEIFKENNIQSFEQALECDELWNLNNGITYCLDCHKKIHKEEYGTSATPPTASTTTEGSLYVQYTA